MIICKSDAELGSNCDARLSHTLVRDDRVFHRLAQVLSGELDQMTDQHNRSQGAVPSFTGYNGFPASICTSVDERRVHETSNNVQMDTMSYDNVLCAQELTLVLNQTGCHFYESEMRR
ncbi:hypothetical protein [Paenibacillus sp. Marseille-Q4541]|uniref:hypothetical protein n=1 Tax=Paenibacillus sp. Marseille-Q4541 TaxID=2831522 RepID=UPI001BA53499|nr:hypothetical protein [Paenibacillus sp. Marseille-Q4541]